MCIYAIFARRVSLVEQELLALPDRQSSAPVLVGFVVLDRFVLSVCLVDH